MKKSAKKVQKKSNNTKMLLISERYSYTKRKDTEEKN